jgi:4-aminobutyrate aminotransferase/(S)-3-amino-2-methylpropionate transaminase
MPKAICLTTPLPGPRSRALMERREASVPRAVGHSAPLFVERAEGARLFDVDGNALLDFAGGIGVMNVGHAAPRVVAAASEQLGRFTHTCFSVVPYEPYVALAERLNALAPGRAPKKTFLANSGAEAVENAVKIARAATGRPGVVVFEHAFHGRTLLAMTMTSKVKPYKHGFGPFAPEVYRLPFPYEYRLGAKDEVVYAAELDAFFKSNVAPDTIAAVVIELVTGEGGFIVAPPAFVRALSKACAAHGILLVADEVQTGFARTGRLFASEHYGLEPDLVVLAKSLGGGLPISAVTGRADVMDAAGPGGLGGTFGGNPVACAAALGALDTIEADGLVSRAEGIGAVVEERFACFEKRFPFVGDARGLGAMRALEIVKDKATKEPDKERTDAVLKRAWQNGLVLIGAGTWGNVIRVLMPLAITDDELAEGLAVLEHALFA